MSLFGKHPEKPWIRDLTSTLKDGTVYKRSPLVLSEIGTMLGLDARMGCGDEKAST
jgi:hypothetical protein